MSKTTLIAKRELMENMRTKTFWIGILIAPIGIAVFYVVSFLLAGATSVREYVVLDRTESQWFSTAVKKRGLERTIDGWVDSLPALDLYKLSIRAMEKKLGKPLSRLLLPKTAEDQAAADKLKALEVEGLEMAKAEQKLQQLPDSVRELFEERGKKLRERIADEQMHEKFKQVDFEAQGEDSEKILNKRLQDDELFGYFVIDAKLDGGDHKYVSQNVTDFKLRSWFSSLATDVLRKHNIGRLEKQKGLTKKDVANIQADFSFAQKSVTSSGEQKKVSEADMIKKWAPVAFVYILWLSVFMAAQMLLTNTVEEKSNRIIEVLLSSVSPSQLMHGKIYGIAATGLVVVGSWALFAYLGIKLAPYIAPSTAEKFANWGIDEVLGDPLYLGSFLMYFLAGYLIFASILVALGSVCNSLKEAQNLQQPVVFLLIVPMVTMLPIAFDPNGMIAKVMTYIPLYTPFAMMNRAGGPPPTWEYIASSILILVTLWIGFKGASKIFRVGVLMTGKPPKMREILGWLRAPV